MEKKEEKERLQELIQELSWVLSEYRGELNVERKKMIEDARVTAAGLMDYVQHQISFEEKAKDDFKNKSDKCEFRSAFRPGPMGNFCCYHPGRKHHNAICVAEDCPAD